MVKVWARIGLGLVLRVVDSLARKSGPRLDDRDYDTCNYVCNLIRSQIRKHILANICYLFPTYKTRKGI